MCGFYTINSGDLVWVFHDLFSCCTDCGLFLCPLQGWDPPQWSSGLALLKWLQSEPLTQQLHKSEMHLLPHWDSLQHWGETVYKASVFLPQSCTSVQRKYFSLKICKFNYRLSSTGIAMKELWWLPFNYFWLDLWCKWQQNQALYNPKGSPWWSQRSWKGEAFWKISVIPVCFSKWHKGVFFDPLVAVSTNEAKYNLNWFNEVLQVLEVLTENEVV